MELTISLPKEVEFALKKRTRETGREIMAVVENLIESGIGADSLPERKKNFQFLLNKLRSVDSAPEIEEIKQEVDLIRGRRYSQRNEY